MSGPKGKSTLLNIKYLPQAMITIPSTEEMDTPQGPEY